MRQRFFQITWPSIALCAIAFAGCSTSPTKGGPSQGIVGAWLLTIPEAPFRYHMMIFHSDGTLIQSNPDAGDANTSDSNGMGGWEIDGDRIAGKFIEVTADRSSRKFVSRGEIAFTLLVQGDSLRGEGKAHFYNAEGASIGDQIVFSMSGSRIRVR